MAALPVLSRMPAQQSHRNSSGKSSDALVLELASEWGYALPVDGFAAELVLAHMDFGAVPLELHLVHELVDQEDNATVVRIHVLAVAGVGNVEGVEAVPGSRTTMSMPRSSSQPTQH